MRARRVMRRRSIARTAATTAVVAGTAAAVGGAVHHHQNKKYSQQEYEQQMADEKYPPEPEQYAVPDEQTPEADLTSQLQQLAKLHESGVLTDEEFAAAKGKLLAE